MKTLEWAKKHWRELEVLTDSLDGWLPSFLLYLPSKEWPDFGFHGFQDGPTKEWTEENLVRDLMTDLMEGLKNDTEDSRYILVTAYKVGIWLTILESDLTLPEDVDLPSLFRFFSDVAERYGEVREVPYRRPEVLSADPAKECGMNRRI